MLTATPLQKGKESYPTIFLLSSLLIIAASSQVTYKLALIAFMNVSLIVSTAMRADDAHAREQITIQDMERHMNSVGDDDLIVRHIPFDITK